MTGVFEGRWEAAANPFRPTFGAEPPMLAGRDAVVGSVAKSLDEGVGSPGRATLLTGARGTGKTVLLSEIEDEARQRGWLVIAETANPGLIERLVEDRIPEVARHVVDPEPQRRVTGASAGPVGLSWENRNPARSRRDLRGALADLSDLLDEHRTGVLITVDELHGGHIDELRILGTTIQHCFREGRDVAFVGAGLPSAVSSLLSDQVLTFLRRADRHRLGPLAPDDVASALVQPIESLGRAIEPGALHEAVEASAGYPFLIQAIGYHSWEQQPAEQVITLADVVAGVAIAHDKIGRLVVEPALSDLSDTDRTFLAAMALDDGPSRMSEIRDRLEASNAFAGNYRARLLDADMIVSIDLGVVDFAAPWMREHVRHQLHVEPDDLPSDELKLIAGLSRGDKAFLAAMAVDDGPSRIRDVRDRLGGATADHASQYRRRLLAGGFIVAPERGVVDFASEVVREAVRNQIPRPAPPEPRAPGHDIDFS